MNEDFLKLEHIGSTAIVSLNRPDKLNALNIRIILALKELMAYLANDTGVYSVILTGVGEKAFAAGADISEISVLDANTAYSFSNEGQNVFSMIENMDKPVIAAVNGFALGGGCELALACHIRIASENARFGFPETGLGLIPGFGGTQRMARIAGQGRTYDYILSGDLISAPEALQMGLVSRVFPQNQLLEKAREIAMKIGGKGQLAVRQALKTIRAGADISLSDGLKTEAQAFTYCCATEDFKEGTSAFLEKREPRFRNH